MAKIALEKIEQIEMQSKDSIESEKNNCEFRLKEVKKYAKNIMDDQIKKNTEYYDKCLKEIKEQSQKEVKKFNDDLILKQKELSNAHRLNFENAQRNFIDELFKII